MAQLATSAPKQLIPKPFYRHTYGYDSASNFTDMPDEAAFDMLNMEGREEGLLSSRDGSSKFLTAPLAFPANKIFDFTKNDGTQKILAFNGNFLSDITSGTASNIFSGITPGVVPGCCKFNDRFLFGDGFVMKKYTGSQVWDMSVPAPTAYPSLATGVAGSITLTTGQKYHVTFYNSTTGEESGPYLPDNLAGAPTTGPITSKRVDVTRPSVPGSDPQVDMWRIYKTDDGGASFKLHVIDIPIGTTTYNDNVTVPAFTTTLNDNDDPAPVCEILCEYKGSVFGVPKSTPHKIRWCKTGNSSSWPLENEKTIGSDGEGIIGLFVHNKLLWIIKKTTVWVLPDHPDNQAIPFIVASKGGFHKDAVTAIENYLMIQAKDANFYVYEPTQYSFGEVRWNLRSFNLRGFIASLTKTQLSNTRAITWSGRGKTQLWFAVPYQTSFNNRVLVFENSLAKMNKKKESWWIWKFNYPVVAMAVVKINSDDFVLLSDDQGEVYKFPDTNGDGAEINGTVTGATSNTLSDSTKTWSVDLKNLYVRIIDGLGKDQEGRITSNTATQITVTPSWAQTPDTTSKYTIGGYDKFYFTNWKNYGKEALRKRLRFIRVVGRQQGNYTIDVIVKKDFQASDGSSIVLPFSLLGSNSLWGIMMWGIDPWGGATVVKGRLKFKTKFNSVQIGFRNRQAGQPFRIEGFTTFTQGLYWRTKQ